ncbi:MAG: hypothetical protein DCF20_01510 [Pseudanabaena sp.]|nr:MAG: hypothetical protein DCF20_01510 [Pseudanabaena sp.]
MGAIAFASAIFTTALPSTVSASDAKAKECQMISNTVVQANFKVANLEKPSEELKFFNLMSQNLKSLALTDARLQILRDVLIAELKDREDLWKKSVPILDKGDPKEIEVLKIRLDLKRKSGRVVAEMFNEYCFGS